MAEALGRWRRAGGLPPDLSTAGDTTPCKVTHRVVSPDPPSPQAGTTLSSKVNLPGKLTLDERVVHATAPRGEGVGLHATHARDAADDDSEAQGGDRRCAWPAEVSAP